MGDIVMNIARGMVKYYAGLPATNDAFIIVLLRGAESDDAIADHDTLSALLASNTEANFTNYARKTVTTVTVTVNDATNETSADIADQVWTSAGGATNNTVVKALVCYDADTTSGTDANVVPLLAFDFIAVTDGFDLTWQPSEDGIWRSTAA